MENSQCVIPFVSSVALKHIKTPAALEALPEDPIEDWALQSWRWRWRWREHRPVPREEEMNQCWIRVVFEWVPQKQHTYLQTVTVLEFLLCCALSLNGTLNINLLEMNCCCDGQTVLEMVLVYFVEGLHTPWRRGRRSFSLIMWRGISHANKKQFPRFQRVV